MPQGRPAIPADLDRAVRVEAGHRCAIPICRQTDGLQIAHIISWATAQTHEFVNLILLCAICHIRFDRGEIDRKAMQQYKANLGLLNRRYGDFERRVLEILATEPRRSWLNLSPGSDIHLWYLVKDGILQRDPNDASTIAQFGRLRSRLERVEVYLVTDTGREFIDNWARGLGIAAE